MYLLKWVLHDWGDERCVRILDNCRAVLPPAGRLVIIERLVPESLQPDPASNAVLIFDIVMLVTGGTGGAQERALRQYDALLPASHLQRREVTPLTEEFVAITASLS